jgi:site-specific recombinase XerD
MENTNFLMLQQDFLKGLELKGKSFNTVKNYKADLNCFNKFLNEKGKIDTVLTEFNAVQVQEYATFIENKYSSSNSKRRRIQAVRLFFDFLMANNIVDDNPIKKIVTAPKIVDLPRPIPMENINKLFIHIHEKYRNASGLEKLIQLRNEVMLFLIYGGGLKVSDIARLKEEHILLGADGNYRVMVIPPKRDPYTIELAPSFNKMFKEYINALSIQKAKQAIEFKELLFNANPYQILSGGLSSRGCEVIFKEFTKQLNADFTARQIRQSCIFKWLNQALPQARVKEWMGVQPQYSLTPYMNLLKDEPEKYKFVELSSLSYE